MDSAPGQKITTPAAAPDTDLTDADSGGRQLTDSIFERLAAAAIAPAIGLQPEEQSGTPSFARGLWRIAAADVSSGNRVALLRDGAATFSTMLDLIDNARRSVNLEGYIFRDDEVGQQFARSLTAAAGRGVKVRLLVDWVGRMGTPSSFFHAMARDGVEVRIFNRPGFRRWLGIVPRDHRKLLVVDDHAGVTGGIGIGREWKTGVLKRRRAPWRDTAVLIEGDAAGDMVQAYERMWRRATGTERRGSHRHLTRRGKSTYLDPSVHPPALVGIIEGEPGRFRISRALQMQAVSAERSIWIASAYFMPGASEVEALTGAARDGVDVRVLVPSRYDHPWIRLATRHFYRRLLRNGVRIWEWRGEMMHAKTSVVDSRWTRIGSTDYNPLGIAINFELDAVIEDRVLGAQAATMFLEDLELSKEITINSAAAR
jgi:cardiolipin synthase